MWSCGIPRSSDVNLLLCCFTVLPWINKWDFSSWESSFRGMVNSKYEKENDLLCSFWMNKLWLDMQILQTMFLDCSFSQRYAPTSNFQYWWIWSLDSDHGWYHKIIALLSLMIMSSIIYINLCCNILLRKWEQVQCILHNWHIA